MGLIGTGVRLAGAASQMAASAAPQQAEEQPDPPPTSREIRVARATGAQAEGFVPLNAVRDFLTTILYATDEQLDALTLVLAVTHATDAFNTLPRVLVTSDSPRSGKSTVMSAAKMLAGNAWLADPTGPALKAKFIEPQPDGGSVTLLLDEISKVFGESGLNGRTSPVYRILTDGYTKNGSFSHSVAKVAMDVSCFCVAFMAGLRTAAPEDLQQRSIRIVLKPKPNRLKLEDALDSDTQLIADVFRETLHGWARQNTESFREISKNGLHRIHPKLTDRRRQIWGPLFAVASAAGDDWPQRCLESFSALALDSGDRPVLTPDQQITLDIAKLVETEGTSHIFTADAVDYLRTMDDRPLWEGLSDRSIAKLMASALGPTYVIEAENRAGEPVSMRGRFAPVIIALAESIRARLRPAVAEEELDELDLEFMCLPLPSAEPKDEPDPAAEPEDQPDPAAEPEDQPDPGKASEKSTVGPLGPLGPLGPSAEPGPSGPPGPDISLPDALQRDVAVIAEGSGLSFVSAAYLAGELQKIGSPAYAGRSITNLTRLISISLPFGSERRYVDGTRIRGYATSRLASIQEGESICKP